MTNKKVIPVLSVYVPDGAFYTNFEQSAKTTETGTTGIAPAGHLLVPEVPILCAVEKGPKK